MSDKIKFYTDFIKHRLSDERFVHSVKTAEMCRELAVINDYDPEKAYLAGILHDICKEDKGLDPKKLKLPNFPLDPIEKREYKLLHAAAGAVFINKTLKIKDMDILAAVRFHTVGRAKMSKLEKILYLGDLVEHGRHYPEIEKYREFALDNLDNGMYEALKWAVNDNLNKRKSISHYTLKAYNYYNERQKNH
jgi:predicted HD superfamily hydrolase involved in NAD metabolism